MIDPHHPSGRTTAPRLRSWASWGGIPAITVTLIFVVEIVATSLLPVDRQRPVMYDPMARETFAFLVDRTLGFDVLDPLLGWAWSEQRLHERGFDTHQGRIVLHSGPQDTPHLIDILITGGSTADPAIIAHNWPLALRHLLDSMGISARISIGAVGGYHTGQELLGLLRERAAYTPNIHISYHGANEAEPFYVTHVEQGFFDRFADLRPAFLFMPNTFALLHGLAYRQQADMHLRSHLPDNAMEMVENGDAYGDIVAGFWKANVHLMHRLAHEDGYAFIAIVQPVLGSGTYRQEVTAHYAPQHIMEYGHYYHRLRQHAALHPAFIHDLSAIFDTIAPPVYTDDCHLMPHAQPIIARAVLAELRAKGLL